MTSIKAALRRHDKAVACLRNVERLNAARVGLDQSDKLYWMLTDASYAEHALADAWFALAGGDVDAALDHRDEALRWRRRAMRAAGVEVVHA